MKKLALVLMFIFVVFAGCFLFLAPKKNEFVQADVYDEIIRRGFIKVGINTDSKPFGFINKQGKVDGYDADLSKYIAQYILRNSNKIEFVSVTPSNRLIKASTGEVDIVVSTVTITPSRLEIVDFSIPYDIAGLSILVSSRSSIKSISDLSGKTVGVIFGTTAEKNMKTLVPNANLRGFRSYNEAYLALKQGYIDAVTSDDTILSRFTADDDTVKLLPKRYSQEPYGIAFKQGETTKKLKENLDFAIKDMQQKNVINKLRRKWEIGL